MKTIKQVTVTNVAQEVSFSDKNLEMTQFIIFNRSEVAVTINLDEIAIIGDENCAIVDGRTARETFEKAKFISVIAPSEAKIEIQAIYPKLVLIERNKIV